MNASMHTAEDLPLDGQPVSRPAVPVARQLYWSLARELWENRFIYLAPAIVAGVAFLGFMFSTIGLPGRRAKVLLMDIAQQRAAIGESYDLAAMILMATGFFVGVFYCLDALHGERRDRSILFWKSMPVSDLTTVLSKMSVPMVILPGITFVIVVVLQILMMLWTDVVLVLHGMGITTLDQVPLHQDAVMLAYGLMVLVLWHAPLYAWFLLISGWARRATFLWAVLPPAAVCILEKIALGSTVTLSLIKYRFGGYLALAFAFDPKGKLTSLSQLTPGRYLASPDLWIGLAIAVALLAAVIRLRRNRDPI